MNATPVHLWFDRPKEAIVAGDVLLVDHGGHTTSEVVRRVELVDDDIVIHCWRDSDALASLPVRPERSERCG